MNVKCARAIPDTKVKSTEEVAVYATRHNAPLRRALRGRRRARRPMVSAVPAAGSGARPQRAAAAAAARPRARSRVRAEAFPGDFCVLRLQLNSLKYDLILCRCDASKVILKRSKECASVTTSALDPFHCVLMSLRYSRSYAMSQLRAQVISFYPPTGAHMSFSMAGGVHTFGSEASHRLFHQPSQPIALILKSAASRQKREGETERESANQRQ